MNVRKIREELGRSKNCLQRRDFHRALYLFCLALKELGPQGAPADLRGDIRAALTDICADPVYKNEYPAPLSYQPGKEKDLLVFFNNFYKALLGTESREDYETTLQRKLNLDRCINNGKAFLAQGKASEADDCFNEAFKYYKNEIAAYAIMARAMMDAKEYVRALGYARKGLQEKPDQPDLKKLAVECSRLRASSGR